MAMTPKLSSSSLSSTMDLCEARRCLVCGAISLSAHFGAQACRACAAFFRRCVVLNCCYTCKHRRKCTISAVRTNCRACRFEKCLEIGMRPDCKGHLAAYTKCSGIIAWKSDVAKKTTTIMLSPRTLPEVNTVARLQLAYAQMKNFRRSIYEEAPPHLVTAAELNRRQLKEIKLAGEFSKIAFCDKNTIPEEQMQILSSNFFYHFNVLEVAFETFPSRQIDLLHFPNNGRFNFTDPWTYAQHDDGSPNKHAAKTAKLFERHKCLLLRRVHGPMLELSLDETEMLAIAALLFWLKDADGLDEETLQMASRAQQRIVTELFEYIKKKRKEQGDAAIRLSQLALLVSSVQKMVNDLRSLFEMHRALGLYKANTHCQLFDAISGDS